MNFDPQDVCRAIDDVAKQEILPFFRHLDADDIFNKGNRDVVTMVDLRAEKALSTALRKIAPASAVIGEEASEEDPNILNSLDDDRPFWIVDPLDGTKNFIAGRPVFAVIVAFCERGETQAGWIYDPCGEVMVHAHKGGGAWLGARPLGISDNLSPSQSTASLGPGMRKRLHAHTHARSGDRAPPPEIPERIVRYGCCGREYIDLALGKIQYAAYGGNLNVWDHAAGVLIHREAGGYSAIFPHEAPYRPQRYRHGEQLLLAPSPPSWASFRQKLMP
ncbi:inositol monophosphatase family protein [Varunaivibrio sulfuroxidans]|uniref:Fructose-1,6-bisphosphatase/inositol monophosphatase family enzyme n=1 Tax=Varunaivibrio sulfuroxidans TaxID=1773489 RepID=A0A4R3J787_9PROT|nr:inositol monophosphatase [Varunaivibrio sulfuroxidans]TCS61215.1 fructose-1,6-bisphosphatase/inositol monophosphatase family enzyme [Varunaivibrio sulfuroxidans]WES31164.1 inositol monophosphatase [Varunaivibrio sulfuroxidans]